MFSDTLPESIIKGFSLRIKASSGINLGQGIPSFPTPNHILDAARASLSDPAIGIYPNFWGHLELRQAIAEKLHADYTLSLDATNQVLITVGAMEATASIILSLISEGDRVGVITPDYCNHFPQIQLARGTTVEIPLIESTRWELDLSAVEREAKLGLKLLIITNPSNPTGFIGSKAEIDALVKLSDTYGFSILSDETYSFLSYDRPFVSLLSYVNGRSTIYVVRSFSKEYAMTGWRVGYIIGDGTKLKSIVKTHDALVGCSPKISQMAALGAIRGSQTVVNEFRDILLARRNKAVALLQSVPHIQFAVPEGAYYIFFKYDLPMNSMEAAERLLTEANVACIPGSSFGASGEHHLRLSYAVTEEVFAKGVIAISDWMKKQG